MIAYLSGILADKKPNHAIIDIQGVGYWVGISLQCSSELPETGAAVKLHIYHHITENDQRLFGFLEEAEMHLFEALITVKGVGPKMALTILSGLNSRELRETIVRQDITRLSKIPGIGRKTAERMVVELKDKLGGTNPELRESGASDIRSESIAALESLGYRRADAENVVGTLLRNPESAGTDLSELIKMALKQLYK